MPQHHQRRSRVHDAAPGDAVPSTALNSPRTKVWRSKVLLHSPQPGGSQSTKRAANVSIPGWDEFSKQQRVALNVSRCVRALLSF